MVVLSIQYFCVGYNSENSFHLRSPILDLGLVEDLYCTFPLVRVRNKGPDQGPTIQHDGCIIQSSSLIWHDRNYRQKRKQEKKKIWLTIITCQAKNGILLYMHGIVWFTKQLSDWLSLMFWFRLFFRADLMTTCLSLMTGSEVVWT